MQHISTPHLIARLLALAVELDPRTSNSIPPNKRTAWNAADWLPAAAERLGGTAAERLGGTAAEPTTVGPYDDPGHAHWAVVEPKPDGRHRILRTTSAGKRAADYFRSSAISRKLPGAVSWAIVPIQLPENLFPVSEDVAARQPEAAHG